MSQLTKKERLLVEEHKVKYRFETAKTFNETMEQIRQLVENKQLIKYKQKTTN